MKHLMRVLMLLLVLALPVAAGAQQRVVDTAQVFSPAEAEEITRAVDALIQETGMDYAVLTLDEDIGSQTQHEAVRAYYRSLGLGTGDDSSGALYSINFNTNNRYEYLYTDGKMIDYMTDARIEQALDKSNPLLRDGRYADAALAMIAAVQGFVKQGIPEGQYRYSTETGEILTARYKVVTNTELLIGIGICLLIGIAFVLIVRSRYKLKGSTYHYDYNANAKVHMTDQDDRYLRTTTTRTRRAQSSGSGGGGGFGGGSGVHSGGGGGGGRGF